MYVDRVADVKTTLALDLIITATNLQRIKASIINVLIDTNHGTSSPNLLSLKQLQEELVRIRYHLSKSLQIPIENNHDIQLYK